MKDKLINKLKSALIKNLTSNKQILDNPYVSSGRRTWTRRQMAEEVENNTDEGINLLVKLINLAARILDKENKRENPEHEQDKNIRH